MICRISVICKLALALLSLCAIGLSSVRGAPQNSRRIVINNHSGNKVELFWIHPQTKEKVLQSNPFIYNGATFSLKSFVTHSFEAREIPGGKSGKCAGEDHTCHVGYFSVNENDDQVIFIDKNFDIKHQDNVSVARENAQEMINECKKSALDNIKAENNISAAKSVESIAKCIESSVTKEVEKAKAEISLQAGIRKKMAQHFENYTCADYDMPSTEPIESHSWYHKGKSHKIEVLLNRAASKVHHIKNFISPEECALIQQEAETKLTRATVSDGKGGRGLSPVRKAMQAKIKVPWNLEKYEHPITSLSRRVFDYTNHVLGMGIKENGQEDLMSIHYFGRGEGDQEPDRYIPHCDGFCDGMEFMHGNRMATMVMYCTIPTKGGATNFRNSGIHVVPEEGSATFFSYIDPNTMIMDNGFTEHSGCPVVEGEKKIVTQWIRYGVDDENHSDLYNTLGFKKSEMEV